MVRRSARVADIKAEQDEPGARTKKPRAAAAANVDAAPPGAADRAARKAAGGAGPRKRKAEADAAADRPPRRARNDLPRDDGAIRSALVGKNAAFGPLIDEHGLPKLERAGDYYQELVRSICYQQLAGKAASAIWGRFVERVGGSVSAAAVLKHSVEELRAVGLSYRKAEYILAVSDAFESGELATGCLDDHGDEEIIEKLTRIRGVGRWTAQMFLIFTMGRIDVLPTGDLGVRKGAQRFFGTAKLPTEPDMERLFAPFEGYRSVASWLMWRVVS